MLVIELYLPIFYSRVIKDCDYQEFLLTSNCFGVYFSSIQKCWSVLMVFKASNVDIVIFHQ